jgi:DegV family protein with EDD domain
MIKIVADSSSLYNKESGKECDIEICPLGVTIDNKAYKDLEDICLESILKDIAGGAMPKTSQVNVGIARKHFEKYLKEKKDVLVIAFSSGLSGTYNSYCIAANELNEEYENKVYVVDSLCASLGQGLFLDYIIKFSNKGKSIIETRDYAEELKLKIRHEFTVDDLFHLKRGGRVSATTAIVGSLIGIKPILHVDDNGKLIAIDKVRGRKASLKQLSKYFIENNDISDNEPVFISHADAIEDANYLKNLILEIRPNIEVYINYIGPVIGAHAGQGTIALFYRGKNR